MDGVLGPMLPTPPAGSRATASAPIRCPSRSSASVEGRAHRRGLRPGPTPVLGLVGALVSNDMQTGVNADAENRQVA